MVIFFKRGGCPHVLESHRMKTLRFMSITYYLMDCISIMSTFSLLLQVVRVFETNVGVFVFGPVSRTIILSDLISSNLPIIVK